MRDTISKRKAREEQLKAMLWKLDYVQEQITYAYSELLYDNTLPAPYKKRLDTIVGKLYSLMQDANAECNALAKISEENYAKAKENSNG